MTPQVALHVCKRVDKCRPSRILTLSISTE
jgi:hypothetical protein